MSNKGFVFLDFKNKLVYFAKEKRVAGYSWTVPATEKEWAAFITHFYSKGQKECTFRELKQYVKFHGSKIKDRIYATVNITDEFVYMKLLEKDETMQNAVLEYINATTQRHRESEIKTKSKIVAKHVINSVLKSLENEMERILDY